MAYSIEEQSAESLAKARGYLQMHPLSDIQLIRENKGNVAWRALTFATRAEAEAILAWFEEHDSAAFKQWCFINARAQMACTVRFGDADELQFSPAGTALNLLLPVLCDDEATISWFANADERFVCELTERPKSTHFYAYQTVLALRGDWERLAARSLLALSDPPRSKDLKPRVIEYELFLAMAKRDVATIERVIEEMTSPKGIRARNLWEGPFFMD